MWLLPWEKAEGGELWGGPRSCPPAQEPSQPLLLLPLGGQAGLCLQGGGRRTC